MTISAYNNKFPMSTLIYIYIYHVKNSLQSRDPTSNKRNIPEEEIGNNQYLQNCESFDPFVLKWPRARVALRKPAWLKRAFIYNSRNNNNPVPRKESSRNRQDTSTTPRQRILIYKLMARMRIEPEAISYTTLR